MELSLNQITQQYGETAVLKDITFTLTPGVYGLLGANGAGKTTLFKIICGLLLPTAGTIQYNQQAIQTQGDYYRSHLGFLPQDFRYYPDFSGLKFMLYIAALKGLNSKAAKNKCTELLSIVGLEDVKHKKIKTYSGGMKQRLGIAQAMINDPEILILDEPTVGLDPKERVHFRNLLASLATKKIVLLSTHIVSDVEYIADEILILKKGKLENRGTAQELLQEIKEAVWEVVVTKEQANELRQTYTISNQRHTNNGDILLRIVAKTKPLETALQVTPILEDLYLYHFRQEGSYQ